MTTRLQVLQDALALASKGEWRPAVWRKHIERMALDGQSAEAVFTYTPPATRQIEHDTIAMCALRNLADDLIVLVLAAKERMDAGHDVHCPAVTPPRPWITECACGHEKLADALIPLLREAT